MKEKREHHAGHVYADRIRAYCECGREIVQESPVTFQPHRYICECGNTSYLYRTYPYWDIRVEERTDV